MNQKIFLLLATTLKFSIDFSPIQKNKWIEYCKTDNQRFNFMQNQSCDLLFNDYQFSQASFVNTFNSLLGDRDIEFVSKGHQKVVIKRLMDTDDIQMMQNEVDFNDERSLERYFLDDSRIGGSYICHPGKTVEKFYEMLPLKHLKNRHLFWTLLNMNIQPLIFETFKSLPVPRQLDLIGITSVTDYKGQSLVDFIASDFNTRILISKLLLEGVMKLTSNDLKGFRIYLTDLTLDNIVFDPATQQITFVDMDNVILIDSNIFSGAKSNSMHIHEKFECNGCFAYSIDDVCGAPISDINIFAVCQLLLEDLYENKSKGFIYSAEMKEKFPGIWYELKKCVHCKQPNCDRFKSASILSKMIENVLKEVGK